MKYAKWVLLLCALSAPGMADQTTKKINNYLERKYYRIEFILFERNSDTAIVGGESLGVDQPGPWPLAMMTMPADDPSLAAAYSLDLFSRTQLDWPILQSTFKGTERGFEIVESVPQKISALDEQPLQDGEHPAPKPDLEDNFLVAMQDYEASLMERSFQMFEQRRLSSQAKRISRRHRIIFHGAWQQPIQSRAQPMPILFQPEADLEGVFGVTLGRYLHFQIDIWKRINAFRAAPVQPIDTPVDPRQPAFLQEPQLFTQDTWRLPEISEIRYLHFKESRRMRSEELHYLDHPRFGLVVRIDPMQPPEDLVVQFRELEVSRKANRR